MVIKQNTNKTVCIQIQSGLYMISFLISNRKKLLLYQQQKMK